MGILSFFRPNSGSTESPNAEHTKLRPAWKFLTRDEQSVIWKLLISPSGILAGEERNVEAHTADLCAIEVATGTVLWRNVPISEAWWFGSELVSRHSLYLHTFPTPDMPQAQGIIAIDLETGRERWRRPEFVLMFEANERVYAGNPRNPHELIQLDLLSGEEIERLRDPNAIAALKSLVEDSDDANVYPFALTEESDAYSAIAELITSTTQEAGIRGTIDFAEYDSYIVYSFHRRLTSADAALRNALANELYILNRESGELVYHDTLNGDTPFPIPDNFFIHRGTLIYVKEKREIVGVALA